MRSWRTDRIGAIPVPGPTQTTGLLISGGSLINPLLILIRNVSPNNIHLL